jgi:hypothetical protein
MMIPTFKMDPAQLRSINAQISGEQPGTEPQGKELLRIMFKVGGTMRLIVEVLSCGPGERAAVSTRLFRKISEDEYELVSDKIPDRLPLDRECFCISDDRKEYHARISPA